MATIVLQAELTPQMVVQAVKGMSEEELALLEQELRRERIHRLSLEDTTDEEALLLVANEPPPHGERYGELVPKWQAGTLSEAERAEMIAIVEAREHANVNRVAAIMRLSKLRNVDFAQLWRQIVGPPPEPISLAG